MAVSPEVNFTPDVVSPGAGSTFGGAENGAQPRLRAVESPTIDSSPRVGQQTRPHVEHPAAAEVPALPRGRVLAETSTAQSSSEAGLQKDQPKGEVVFTPETSRSDSGESPTEQRRTFSAHVGGELADEVRQERDTDPGYEDPALIRLMVPRGRRENGRRIRTEKITLSTGEIIRVRAGAIV